MKNSRYSCRRCEERSKGRTPRGSCKSNAKKLRTARIAPETRVHLLNDDAEDSAAAPRTFPNKTEEIHFQENMCSCESDDDVEEVAPYASCFQRMEAFVAENYNLSCRRSGYILETFFRRLSVAPKSCESFTAISFFIEGGAWQCTGVELQSKTWKPLPTLAFLPTPDVDLFKEYSVSGDDGLMCVNVSKLPHREHLVVFNPLSGASRTLPPLQWPRNPVLVHITVDPGRNSYKVIAAGSSSCSGGSHLSRKVEVFDSRTKLWTPASEIPGLEFALNEHQSGVFLDGVLYLLAFLDQGSKGVLALDVEKGEWLRSWGVPLANMLQLVGSGGKVYVFSEQEELGGASVEHCIDVLEGCELKSVTRVRHAGGRGLLVYPEYTCVPFGEGKMCVLNTIKRDGVIYDVQSGMQCEVLEAPPVNQRGDHDFFTLNPVSFTLQPNFLSKP